jgi:hypothetical protein
MTLSPVQCVQRFLGSDACPEKIKDPERLALAVIRVVLDSGYDLVPSSERRRER